MKTQFKALCGAIALFFLFTNNMQAQSCTYNVHNNTNCPVDVTVEYFDAGGSCNFVSTTISPNSPQVFGCASCGPITDIKVTLVRVGGIPAGLSVDSANTTAGPFNTPCTVSGDVNLNWAAADTAIIP